MKKKIMLIVLSLVFMLAGCSNNKEKIETENQHIGSVGNKEVVSPTESKIFVVGLDPNLEPLGYVDENGDIVGFEVDLAKEVARRNGYEVSFKTLEWEEMTKELIDGKINCIWSGYSITEEREQYVLFSEPYVIRGQVIVTMEDSGIKNESDLLGKTISVQKNSQAAIMFSSDKNFIKNAEICEFDTLDECFLDLQSGRSEAIMISESEARNYLENNQNNSYKVLEKVYGGEEYAVGVRKEDEAFVNVINQTLDEMKNDGTYDAIYDRWF